MIGKGHVEAKCRLTILGPGETSDSGKLIFQKKVAVQFSDFKEAVVINMDSKVKC